MARKARRATAKAAAAEPAGPPPPADQDGEDSTTGTAEGVATTATGVGADQLLDGAALNPSRGVDGDKSHLEGVPADASAPIELDTETGELLDGSAAVVNGGTDTSAAAQPASVAIAPPVFASPANLPPIPSTSQQPRPEREYTAEEVQAWREQQIDAKQAQLTEIVDRHDDLVRELFHLDRFVTLVGYDPAVAKADRSDVFQSFQANYDLFLNATPDGAAEGFGRRGTRRATTERKIGALATPDAAGRWGDPKGKGKAREDSSGPSFELSGSGRAGGKKAVGPRGRKAGSGSPAPSSCYGGGSLSPAPSANMPYKKRPSEVLAPSRSSSQIPFNLPPLPALPVGVGYKPVVANLADLPSMLKDDLPPLSPRSVKRRRLWAASDVTYSHMSQLPPDPEFDFSLPAFLGSWVSLDDDTDVAPPPPEEELDARAEYEHDILHQVEAIRAEGRELCNPDRTQSAEAKRPKDHQDWLVEHAIYFSQLVMQERKSHIALARKTARMVMKHFEEIRGKEDREQKEIERNQKALSRWTLREVRKKWKMAVNVVRARRKAEQQKEAKRLGKQQLDLMLNKSTTMLQAQQQEMAGEGSSDEEEDDEEGEEEDEEDEEEDEEDAESTSQAASTPADSSPAQTPLPKANGRRARRTARSRLSTSATPADVDKDAGDAFAGDEDDAERDKEDDAFAAEMEAEDQDDDDEMAGLAAEADMPIEELLRRSGYAAMMAEEAAGGAAEEHGEEGEEEEEEEEEADDVSMVDVVADEVGSEQVSGGNSTSSTNAAPSPSTPGTSAPAGPDLTAEEKEAEAMSEFGSEAGDDERDDEDARMAKEMEAEEGESDDEEMKGLAAEADMPIEELMRKYGYGGGEHREADAAESDRVKPEEEERNVSSEPEEQVDEAEGDEPKGEDGVEEMPQDGTDRQIVHLKPPFLLRATLRPYQQAGLEWLASLYTSGVNGILADEMGLGKTIQTISLLAHLACDKGQWGPHLVVVPTSVMLNWEMEFRKFFPGFKLLTYYGTQKERKKKREGWNTENAFNVCITSYQLVLADQHIFRRKPWHYLILDEAHHIKNFRSQRWQTLLGFNARHRLLLTGTPLQNNLMELWSLLYFLMPHGLITDGSGPFAEHADFQAWFSNPMEKAIESGEVMDAEMQATVNKLHTILRPYLLRRLKAEVETQMPGKTESVIYCRMSKRQRFLYDDFMSRAQTRDTLASGHFLSIINCLMQLRKVCNHPDLFEVRPIVTSFSMQRSVVSGFEPSELLIRKRLLEDEPIAKMDWTTLTLVKPWQEETTSTVAGQIRLHLDASTSFPYLHRVPMDVNLAAPPPRDTKTIAGWRRYRAWQEHHAILSRLNRLAVVNRRRCLSSTPYFGADLLHLLREPTRSSELLPTDAIRADRGALSRPSIVPHMILSHEQRASALEETISLFSFATPKVRAHDMKHHALPGMSQDDVDDIEEEAPAELLHAASTKLTVAFPDRSLLQYDCGKLQKLDELLRECKAGGHRALIFTQMTKVLDILEEFLSYQGYRYLRLDGSTKIEQRQALTERFNSNDKILCFISSTRAGGLGINLQGADTVIFYDSDWNPALDRQCQDRAHRIGQTREVRIWRFVTEHSIEENMLKKANQKRKLDQMVIAEGEFTTDHLQKLDWRDYLDDGQLAELGVDAGAGGGGDTGTGANAVQSAAEIRQALAAAEDAEDVAAAKAAEQEIEIDRTDFGNEGQQASRTAATFGKDGLVNTTAAGQKEEEEDPLAGTIDGVMVRWVEEDWDYFG
ncbi:swr1 complex component [Rhodotorula toruloides]